MKKQEAASGSGDKCPVCGGTGWEFVKRSIEGYDTDHTVAVPCTYCREIRRLADNTGIPLNFCEMDIHKFRFDVYAADMGRIEKLVSHFFENFPIWREKGKGLYLWSKTPGSGKSMLACSLGRSISLKYDLQLRFITAPDYLAAVGDSYKRTEGEIDQSQIYRECDLLILDDIGTQRRGEWQDQEIFRLVNRRYENGLLTIFTSNYMPEKLNFDGRIIDRIRKCSIVVQMPEECVRQKKAEVEQEFFLREIFEDTFERSN